MFKFLTNFVLAGLLTLNLSAQNWQLTNSFTGDVEYSYMGEDVDIDGNFAVVGGNSEFRKAIVYELIDDNWVEIAVLRPEDPTDIEELFFGSKVAIDDDLIIVSSTFANSFRGKVYLFEKPTNGWTNMTPTTELLTDNALEAGANFGAAIAVQNDVVVVGRPSSEGNTSESGRAYVYTKPANGWPGSMTESAVLVPTNAAAYDWFGVDVAIDNNVIAVGSNRDNAHGNAYIFEKPADGWIEATPETAIITTSDSYDNDAFGRFLDLKGDVLLTSISLDNPDTPNEIETALYVFKKGADWQNYEQVAKLQPNNLDSETSFGVEPTLQDNRIFASNFLGNDVFVFDKQGAAWTDMAQTSMITNAGGDNYSFFGRAIAAEGPHVAIGNRQEGFNSNGTIFFYKDVDFTNIETLLTAEVNIYPNPASDELTIDLMNEKAIEVRLSDAAGRQILRVINPDSMINLSLNDVPSGFYFLNIALQNGVVQVEKIVVER